MVTARFADKQKELTVKDYFELQSALFRMTKAETGKECSVVFVDAVDKTLAKNGTCEVRCYVGPLATLDIDITAAPAYL